MNKTENLLLVAAEEILELYKDYFEGKNLILELTDLLAMFELLKEKQLIFELDHRICVFKEREFIQDLFELQYLLFKSLRFGLSDINPLDPKKNTNKEKISTLASEIECQINFYLQDYSKSEISKLKSLKKAKVHNMLLESINKGHVIIEQDDIE